MWYRKILHAKIPLFEILIRLVKYNTDSVKRIGLFAPLLQVSSVEDVNFMEEDERDVDVLISLLHGTEEIELQYSFYLWLLEMLPNLTGETSCEPRDVGQCEKLGRDEDLPELRRSLKTLRLISILSEDAQLQSYMLDHPQQAVHFTSILLNNTVDRLQVATPDLDLRSQSLSMIFTVIALLIHHQLSDNE